MEEDVYFKNSKLPKGYFSEDGITHLFTDELLDFINSSNHNEKDACLSEFFNLRSYIFLTASEDYIMHNLKIRSRKHKNRADDWYTHFGRENIYDFVKNTQRKKYCRGSRVFPT